MGDLDFHPFVTPDNRGKINLPDFESEYIETIDKTLLTETKSRELTKNPKTINVLRIDTIDDLYLYYKSKKMKASEFKKILNNPNAFGNSTQFDTKNLKAIVKSFEDLVKSNPPTTLTETQKDFLNEQLI